MIVITILQASHSNFQLPNFSGTVVGISIGFDTAVEKEEHAARAENITSEDESA